MTVLKSANHCRDGVYSEWLYNPNNISTIHNWKNGRAAVDGGRLKEKLVIRAFPFSCDRPGDREWSACRCFCCRRCYLLNYIILAIIIVLWTMVDGRNRQIVSKWSIQSVEGKVNHSDWLDQEYQWLDRERAFVSKSSNQCDLLKYNIFIPGDPWTDQRHELYRELTYY